MGRCRAIDERRDVPGRAVLGCVCGKVWFIERGALLPAFGRRGFHPLPNPSPLKGEGPLRRSRISAALQSGLLKTGILENGTLPSGVRRFEASPPSEGERFGERGRRRRRRALILQRANIQRLPSAAWAFTLSPTPLPSRERGLNAQRLCLSRQAGALKSLPRARGLNAQ